MYSFVTKLPIKGRKLFAPAIIAMSKIRLQLNVNVNVPMEAPALGQ
jgi:hypothetical protein